MIRILSIALLLAGSAAAADLRASYEADAPVPTVLRDAVVALVDRTYLDGARRART